ncbi:MAG: GMC family oxidoreductase [Deltaproteobacteria bacterium]|nr:GMC family oxidoreductase [Deltaproteobacteria bacterium]
MSGAIYPGTLVTSDLELTADVCIVGSGPGGSVLASRLCDKGLKVVMLEEGGYPTRRGYSRREPETYPMLYQDRGVRATADAAITILQGRTVGGGSVVNWTTSFRTPKATLDVWEREHGVRGIDQAALNPHWDAIEKRLEIHQQPEWGVNANNGVLLRGAKALGLDAQRTFRNTSVRCVNSGYCSFGCPNDGKNDMTLTFIPDAVAKGLEVYADVRAERIELEGRKVARVVASVIDRNNGRPTGAKLTVKPKVLAVSCGAINSPNLLLRSGIDNAGRTGKRTFLHPVILMASEFEQRIDGWYGAPQSAASHHFIDRGPGKVGFFLESAPIHPMLAGSAFQAFGTELEDRMSRMPYTNVLLGLTKDGFVKGDDGGTVTALDDGRPKLDYPVNRHLQEALREACKAMARVQFAAGAKRVATATGVVLNSVDDIAKLDALSYGALDQPLFSAHQMGGCAMGGDPDTSVVDSQLRHRAADNLFVVDGSVFPTSLGVNPQLSIYGISSYASTFVGAAI